MVKNFIMVDQYVDAISWASPYHAHFWLLLLCTLSYWADTNSYPYCYDNIWADIVLENGHPNFDSIYSVIDLFTWEGWLYAWAIYCVHHGFQIIFQSTLFFLMFVVYYYSVIDQPFCVKGEIDIFGWDMCDNEFMYGGISDAALQRAASDALEEATDTLGGDQ